MFRKRIFFVCYIISYINNQCQSLLGYAWSAVGSCSVGHTQPSATHMYTTRSRQKLCWAGRTLPVWNRTLLGFKSVGAVWLPGSWPMMDAVTHTTSGCGSTQKPTVRPLCPKIFFFFNLQRFLFFLAFFSSVTATGICSVRSSTSTPVFFLFLVSSSSVASKFRKPSTIWVYSVLFCSYELNLNWIKTRERKFVC